MKRFVFLVGLVVLVFAVSVWAQPQAPKPGPEQQKAAALVGHWTYEGEYKAGPLGPGGKFTGEYTAELVLKGFFMHGRWVEKGPSGVVTGIENYGYDSANKNYAQSQYQDDGGLAAGALSINGNTWTYSGKMVGGGKQCFIRVTAVFAADLMSMTQKADVSIDGNTWVPFFESRYVKVKPAPKAK